MSEDDSASHREKIMPLPSSSEIRTLIADFPEGDSQKMKEYLVSRKLADAIVSISNSSEPVTFPDVRLLAKYCDISQEFVEGIDFPIPNDSNPETGIKKMMYQSRMRLLDMTPGLIEEVSLASKEGREGGELVLEQYVKSVSWIKEQIGNKASTN